MEAVHLEPARVSLVLMDSTASKLVKRFLRPSRRRSFSSASGRSGDQCRALTLWLATAETSSSSDAGHQYGRMARQLAVKLPAGIRPDPLLREDKHQRAASHRMLSTPRLVAARAYQVADASMYLRNIREATGRSTDDHSIPPKRKK